MPENVVVGSDFENGSQKPLRTRLKDRVGLIRSYRRSVQTAIVVVTAVVVISMAVGGRWAISSLETAFVSQKPSAPACALTPNSVVEHTQTQTTSQSCPSQQTQTNKTIQKENAETGTSDWKLAKPSTITGHQIEGYAQATSVLPSQVIRFSVRTTASSFKADIFRMGWYGGMGARLMQSISGLTGHAYAIPVMDANYLVEAKWPTAFSVTPQANWPSGVYMVKLTDANGYQSYIPFVVKAPTALNALVFIHAVNTDEAYNYYGGASLYPQIRTGAIGAVVKDKEANEVSFDRPFIQNFGAGQFFRYEYPFIRWAERSGYNLSYVTDTDVHENANVLLGTKGVLIVGHDEYWSKQMYDAYDAALAHKVNLANFAANSAFWQVRYAPDSSNTADRRIIAYKGTATTTPKYNGDPEYGKDNSIVTTQFGDPLLNRSAQKLLGLRWQADFEPLWAGPFKVQIPALGVFQSPAENYSWLYANTGLKNGDVIDNLVGYEYDTVDSNIHAPLNVQVVGKNTFTDIWKNHDTVFTTIYTAPGGARVFNAGTIDWAWGLDTYAPQAPDPYAARPQVPSAGIKAVQQMTANILNNFLQAPPANPPQSNPAPTPQNAPAGSPQVSPPTISYTTGSTLFGPASTTTSLKAGDTSWKNYRVSFSFTPKWSASTNQHAGVQVRINGGNFVWVFARPTGVHYAYNTAAGDAGEKALNNATVAANTAHTMQVDAYNETLYVTFDGKAAGNIDLQNLIKSAPTIAQPTFNSGGIKVYSYNTAGTSFRNIVVTTLVATATANTTSQSSTGD